jgi:type 1 glutamine amidotransferase
MFKPISLLLALGLTSSLAIHAEPAHKLLFFSKSSGFEHDVISWKKGQPSFAEKVLSDLGAKHSWTFEFSKDGSKFSPEYLAGFDAVIFYTTGDLTSTGKDGQPAMTAAGKQALFDYVRSGKGFIGLHCATDTFHTKKEDEQGEGACANHGKQGDSYICLVGGEFTSHGAQQVATNKVINKSFPGFADAGESFTLNEEWYALKNFNTDMHVLTVIDSPAMKGNQYQRPPYPTSWAREEGKGRVFYTAMGHREDIWTNPLFQNILTGAVRWTTRDVDAAVPPNLKEAAPGAMSNSLPAELKK